MGKEYTEQETKESINKILTKPIEDLYKEHIINRRGIVKLSSMLYSEFIAKMLLEEGVSDKIKLIEKVMRDKSYKVRHDGKVSNTKRKEENFCKGLFNKYCEGKEQLEVFGRILDYQVPLKGKRADKAGKIDLVSYENSGIYLIEVKIKESKETLLRCVLEISTYYQMLDKEKLIKDYTPKLDGYDSNSIKKAILIFEGSQQDEDIENLTETPNLKRLIKELKIEIFSINPTNIIRKRL